MWDSGTIQWASDRYRQGGTPSQILKEAAMLRPEATTSDLMELMRLAFCLPYPAVQCIGGWWHDGSGELSDAQLDAFLTRAIEGPSAAS
jgi:hypothetical protein